MLLIWKNCYIFPVEITVLSDQGSWKNGAILAMAERLRQRGHQVSSLHDAEAVRPGDILFILGFFKIVPVEILKRNKTNIVVHESSLPKGRGMSPVTWQVIEGMNEIPLSLIEGAVEKVDAGKIYLRGFVVLADGAAEIREKVAVEMVRLCETFIKDYPAILKKGVEQSGPSSVLSRENLEYFLAWIPRRRWPSSLTFCAPSTMSLIRPFSLIADPRTSSKSRKRKVSWRAGQGLRK